MLTCRTLGRGVSWEEEEEEEEEEMVVVVLVEGGLEVDPEVQAKLPLG